MTATAPKPVRNILPAYAIMLFANIGGGLLVLPIFWQLLINTCCCVYIGTLLSTRLKKDSHGELLNYSKSL